MNYPNSGFFTVPILLGGVSRAKQFWMKLYCLQCKQFRLVESMLLVWLDKVISFFRALTSDGSAPLEKIARSRMRPQYRTRTPNVLLAAIMTCCERPWCVFLMLVFAGCCIAWMVPLIVYACMTQRLWRVGLITVLCLCRVLYAPRVSLSTEYRILYWSM